MHFKYNINHYISLMPRCIFPNHVVEQLSKLGISHSQYMRDKNIEQGDPAFIPDEHLAIYAKALGVSVDDLKNYTVFPDKKV